ncbi:hypothetical protein Pmar_PMAR022652 [Perkinsus marinus ATCC 50983]|uniref:Uncharacterized protein n=1 Tax=Perkinsus marinus (strain ATCC 50983 / TXsc) TaxID=423536 RepID=C5L9K2_PERM5|nr:hypothetical protein Pmar_PMAR022652 [Perkinsus marinus ATCC 50983]EER06595.1 hypothetical protein Pmar_PMAR022652 [Perkinsus marinus ATCC 50983]|eukprot:XP_002774779.1 hypothetical protein Pmar_PMAR022652 [Perkinsus marinus ATCC 50983]
MVKCGTDGLRVDYVPSTSDAVLTVPPRCDAMDLEALVWDKLRPKEVRVVMTKEVSSTRGEDGIVYVLGGNDHIYQPLPLGEAIDGLVARIITGSIARKIQITAFVLYHAPHSSSSAILKLADALKTTGEWKLDLKKVRDGFLKLSPSIDNRVSVYM